MEKKIGHDVSVIIVGNMSRRCQVITLHQLLLLYCEKELATLSTKANRPGVRSILTSMLEPVFYRVIFSEGIGPRSTECAPSQPAY